MLNIHITTESSARMSTMSRFSSNFFFLFPTLLSIFFYFQSVRHDTSSEFSQRLFSRHVRRLITRKSSFFRVQWGKLSACSRPDRLPQSRVVICSRFFLLTPISRCSFLIFSPRAIKWESRKKTQITTFESNFQCSLFIFWVADILSLILLWWWLLPPRK